MTDHILIPETKGKENYGHILPSGAQIADEGSQPIFRLEPVNPQYKVVTAKTWPLAVPVPSLPRLSVTYWHPIFQRHPEIYIPEPPNIPAWISVTDMNDNPVPGCGKTVVILPFTHWALDENGVPVAEPPERVYTEKLDVLTGWPAEAFVENETYKLSVEWFDYAITLSGSETPFPESWHLGSGGIYLIGETGVARPSWGQVYPPIWSGDPILFSRGSSDISLEYRDYIFMTGTAGWQPFANGYFVKTSESEFWIDGYNRELEFAPAAIYLRLPYMGENAVLPMTWSYNNHCGTEGRPWSPNAGNATLYDFLSRFDPEPNQFIMAQGTSGDGEILLKLVPNIQWEDSDVRYWGTVEPPHFTPAAWPDGWVYALPPNTFSKAEAQMWLENVDYYPWPDGGVMITGMTVGAEE